MVNPVNIINTLIPHSAVDSVGVYTQDFKQVFREARAIKAVVKEQAKVMEHPVENGSVITDYRIVLPVEIDLSLILNSSDYQSVYKSIRQYFFNMTLLTVQTRAGVYENQIISALPHEEDPNLYDALTIALSLRQVIFVTAQYGVTPKADKNTNTVDRGLQQGKPATSGQNTFAQSVFEGKPLK